SCLSLSFSFSLLASLDTCSSLLSSSSLPQDSNSLSVESSLVTSGTPGLSRVPSLVTVGVIFATLSGSSATVPEPLGSLSGKTSGLDKLRLSRAQIIWGMYFQKNVDYAELLWEDFTYQIDNKEFKKQEKIKKSLRDFYKTYPSGSGTVAEDPLRVAKITPTVTSEGTRDKPGVPDVTKEDSTEKEEILYTLCNSNDEDEKVEGDEEKGVDDTTGKGDDAEMTDAQQEKEKLETIQEQVVEDAHVTITKKTKVSVTSSSHSSDLASKFLNFSDIPHDDAK
nr:hypothetical protein [Tanacetum cinerariifolium]